MLQTAQTPGFRQDAARRPDRCRPEWADVL